jgi:hypothetical protein
MISPWRGTAPELLIAAVAVTAVALAGYVMAGGSAPWTWCSGTAGGWPRAA